MSRPRALIVDDDPEIAKVLTELVEREGFAVTTAPTLAQAREEIAATVPDIVLVDIHLPDGSGLELLEGLGPSRPRGRPDHGTGERRDRGGRPSPRRRRLPDQARGLRSPQDGARQRGPHARDEGARSERCGRELRKLGRFGALVGASPAMQKVYDLIGRVARTDASILLTGETGTGKEVVAQTIHALSRRSKKPFVPVNCGADLRRP